MRDESARSGSGFDKLPSINAMKNRPPPNFDVWNAGFEDQTRPPIPNRVSQHQPPPVENPPQDPHQTQVMSVDTMTALRRCLPNLNDMPDHVFRSFTPSVLLQLNSSSSNNTAHSEAQSNAAMAAAAAAHFAQSAQSAHRNNDPAIKMARALEKLQKNPVAVAAGQDDRITILHIARFLPGWF
jgi:hypothetical protein